MSAQLHDDLFGDAISFKKERTENGGNPEWEKRSKEQAETPC